MMVFRWICSAAVRSDGRANTTSSITPTPISPAMTTISRSASSAGFRRTNSDSSFTAGNIYTCGRCTVCANQMALLLLLPRLCIGRISGYRYPRPERMGFGDFFRRQDCVLFARNSDPVAGASTLGRADVLHCDVVCAGNRPEFGVPTSPLRRARCISITARTRDEWTALGSTSSPNHGGLWSRKPASFLVCRWTEFPKSNTTCSPGSVTSIMWPSAAGRANLPRVRSPLQR